MLRRVWKVFLACCSLFLPSTCPAGELPVDTFFRNYQYAQALISPDGNYLGVLAPVSNRVGLAVIDLKNNTATYPFADRQADVDKFFWLTSDRLAFRLTHAGYAESGLMAVDRDGKRLKRLIGPPSGLGDLGRRLALDWGTRFLSLLPGSTNECLVNTIDKAGRTDLETLLIFPNVKRMDFFTGRMTLEVQNPGHVISWIVDRQGVVRAGVALHLTRYHVLYRPNAKAPWEKIADYNYDEYGIWPIAMAEDNRTLLVSWYGDQDKSAIYSFDPKARKILGVGFRHPSVDADDPILENNRLVGVTCQSERPEVYWFDTNRIRWQQAVDKALTNTVNRLTSTSGEETKAIFLATSDRSPGAYYLLDTKVLRLQKLFELADWVPAEAMAEMRPIEYKSRDGLTIHGYLTLPRGTAPTNLPLVVKLHGGPRSRDIWGFDQEVQFFANRGYAVLQVNFRGSIGYGKSFLEAGDREWGLKQQNDITDGVQWVISQGTADPKRICIYGASYGGFAAMTGLQQTPELYRCGISYAGVIDVERTVNFYRDWTLRNPATRLKMEEAQLIDMLGNKKEHKEHWKKISPLTNVDRIQVPVLLAYSEYDSRVPIDSARDFAKALKKRGKLYDFMVKDNEDHGFHQETNKIELWKKVDEFLKATMQ